MRWFVLMAVMVFPFLAGCGGESADLGNKSGGDENSNSPITDFTQREFESIYFSVTVNFPNDWVPADSSDGSVNNEAFADISPNTETIASFSKDDSAFMTLFASPMGGGDLTDFIRERRPEGDIDFIVDEEADGELAIFDQTEEGERDGFVVDVYLAKGSRVFWFRAELIGTDAEVASAWNEIWTMILSAEIV